jgi:hypothetical protein
MILSHKHPHSEHLAYNQGISSLPLGMEVEKYLELWPLIWIFSRDLVHSFVVLDWPLIILLLLCL